MIAAALSLRHALQDAYRAGDELILLFDYDGTLVPIVDNPWLARLSVQMRAALECLAELPSIHLGVISGRQHRDLRQMLGIPGLFLAGTAGLELDFRGITITHPHAGTVLPLLQEATVRLERLSARFEGSWLERKRVGLTLHFRHISASNVEYFRGLARDILQPFGERLRICDGPLALEVTPNLGWTKGTAARMILGCLPERPRRVLYAGDNANDLEALQAVAEIGGATIGVGAEAPATAEIRISTPEVLGDWLTRLTLELARIVNR